MRVIPLNVLLVLISRTVLIGVLGPTSSFLRILAFVTPWQDLTTSIRSSFSRGASFSRCPGISLQFFFLNERGVLIKWYQDSTCDVCMYYIASVINFCGENVCGENVFRGNFMLADRGTNRKKFHATRQVKQLWTKISCELCTRGKTTWSGWAGDLWTRAS